MSRTAGALWLLLLGLGVLIALFPFISVWRVSGQVLEELPQVLESETTDQRNRFGAMFDDDFVLATRTYRDTTADVVLDALRSDGFESAFLRDRRWSAKACCGDYDAVFVDVQERDSGSAVAVLTVADSDVQVAWPIFASLGIPMAIAGSVLASVGFRKRRQPQSESVPA